MRTRYTHRKVVFAIAAVLALLCCLWDRDGRRAGGSLQITKSKGEIVRTSPGNPKAQLMGGEGFSHPPLSSPFQPQVPAKDVPALVLAGSEPADAVISCLHHSASRCSRHTSLLTGITALVNKTIHLLPGCCWSWRKCCSDFCQSHRHAGQDLAWCLCVGVYVRAKCTSLWRWLAETGATGRVSGTPTW